MIKKKNRLLQAGMVLGMLGLIWSAFPAKSVKAAGEEVIKTGVYADEIDLSGMTQEQAYEAVEAHVESLGDVEVTLIGAENREIKVTARDLGISWGNPQLVEDAAMLGSGGNVIERYKAIKDLAHENKVYEIQYEFDINAINRILVEKCVVYDKKPVNVSLKRENGVFEIKEGQTGYMLDVESSIDLVYDYLTARWDQTPCSIALKVDQILPSGSVQELANVKDVLGTFTTSFSTSGKARSANVSNGCALINGTTLYPGEEFSTYAAVSPFSVANGYYMAGSYVNGKVVDSLGGGICQVSTTLYNAVLKSELQVTERHNHSMIVTYVEPSADAAIAESAGKDFRFVNNTDYPIYIEGSISGKKITFTIYGKETRDPSRQVSYVSEVLETINPPADIIYQDASKPIGYYAAGGSAHIGYKARLWKVVTQNGKEISKEQINSSNYKMSPRSATVGTATQDPNAYNEIIAAIGTGSIDHVKNVIALLTAPPAEDNNTDE